ncbi:MAG: site-specific integrase [Chlamydiae bacterium]|nr:site-specific integrase [Chlamydiota bacterium]
MASIKERKDKDGKTRYYVQIRLKGYDPQCGSFARVTDAKKWIQETEVAIREGRHFKTTEAKKHTLAKMIDRYIENVLPTKRNCIQRQGTQLLWWRQEIGCRLLSDVTPSLIAEKRDKLLKETTVRGGLRSSSTVVRYLAALSHVFTIAVKEWGWLEDSPMRKVTKPREPRGRVRFLSEDERASLLAACKSSFNPFLYISVVLALSTGMRQAELMNLRWSDVDLRNGRVVLQETKNGERRAIPIAGLALQLLKELDSKRNIATNLLFPGKNPRKPIDLRFSWEKVLAETGIKDFRWHDLRHTAASYLAMNKASLAEIAEILGHKTLSMVKRYAHLSESHTAGVVASMNERIFG